MKVLNHPSDRVLNVATYATTHEADDILEWAAQVAAEEARAARRAAAAEKAAVEAAKLAPAKGVPRKGLRQKAGKLRLKSGKRKR